MKLMENTILISGSVWLEGSEVYLDGRLLRPNYCRSTERLAAGDRVVVKCYPGGSVSFTVGDVECSRIVTGLDGKAKWWPFVGLSPAFSSVTALTRPFEQHQVNPEQETPFQQQDFKDQSLKNVPQIHRHPIRVTTG